MSFPYDYQPQTLEEAVAWVFEHMDGLDEFRDEKFSDLILHHHGAGRFFRNHFGLWTGNEALLEDCCKRGRERHPDEASQVIIETVWTRLQARPRGC